MSTQAARFFGVDLAWSVNNPSGVCALDEAGNIVDEQSLSSDEEIIGWIKRLVDGSVVVAIDAPLLVPNMTGRRPCEAAVAREYGSRKAGPHPSNRSLLTRVNGGIRGETLATRLAAIGFADPWAGSDRTLLEVYPHPALIETFGLDERLVYKAKKGVRVADRRRGLRVLSGMLELLGDTDPPLRGPTVPVDDAMRGAALKAVEDKLDARICAWVASIWGSDPGRIRLFGDSETGHIAVPAGRPT